MLFNILPILPYQLIGCSFLYLVCPRKLLIRPWKKIVMLISYNVGHLFSAVFSFHNFVVDIIRRYNHARVEFVFNSILLRIVRKSHSIDEKIIEERIISVHNCHYFFSIVIVLENCNIV